MHGGAFVWSRLQHGGRIQDSLGQKVDSIDGAVRPGSFWLEHLRSKVGHSRCFNCLAPGHRIASCRDPPRCLRCSRFGHKASYCPAGCTPIRPAPHSAPRHIATKIQSRNGQRPLGLSALSSLAFGFVLVNYPSRLRPIPVSRAAELPFPLQQSDPEQLLAYSSPFLVLGYPIHSPAATLTVLLAPIAVVLPLLPPISVLLRPPSRQLFRRGLRHRCARSLLSDAAILRRPVDLVWCPSFCISGMADLHRKLIRDKDGDSCVVVQVSFFLDY
jgi:hypothetical protein